MEGKLHPRFRSILDDFVPQPDAPDLPIGTPICPRCGEPDLAGVEYCPLCGMSLAKAPRHGIDSPVEGVWTTPGPHGLLTYKPVRRRSMAFRVVLMLALVVSTVQAALHVAYYAGLDSLLPSLPVENEVWSDWIQRLAVELLAVTVLACVLGAWWSSRAYRNLIPMQVRGLRFPLALARIGWLVPFLNVWVSKLVVDDLWRASDPAIGVRSSAWRKRRVPLVSDVGWCGIVGGLLLVPLSDVATPEAVAGHEVQLRAALLIGAAGYLLLVLGFAVLAILVEQVTDRQEARVHRLGTSPHPAPLDRKSEMAAAASTAEAEQAEALASAKTGRLDHRPTGGEPVWGSY